MFLLHDLTDAQSNVHLSLEVGGAGHVIVGLTSCGQILRCPKSSAYICRKSSAYISTALERYSKCCCLSTTYCIRPSEGMSPILIFYNRYDYNVFLMD